MVFFLKSLLFVGIVLLFAYIVMYNRKVLDMLAKSQSNAEGIYHKMFGKRMQKFHRSVERKATIDKKSLTYKVSNYLQDIIVNLDLAKDHVTPVGLGTFIVAVSASLSGVFVVWSGEYSLAIPAFLAVLYLVIVLFRFFALLKFENREARIMDAEDLIAMDVSSGVFNAITRYQNSFHPDMKPYFDEFLDNVRNRGYSFSKAMVLLNNSLGSTFTSFAKKAIYYEDKADENLESIFSPIIDINQHKRSLRQRNNKKFDDLRLDFMLSMVVIAAYGIFSYYSDAYIEHVFSKEYWGKLILIIDVVVIAGVLGYISSIKSKFLVKG